MTRAFVGILGLAVVAMMGLAGFQVALSDAGQPVDIDNETWTPDAGNVTELNHSNLDHASYDAEVVVRDADGTLVDPGEDYEWIQANGTVRALVGGELDGDASATISYSYQVSTQEQREVAALLGLIPEAIGLVLPMLAFVVALLLIKR